jgi:hypothetical protein
MIAVSAFRDFFEFDISKVPLHAVSQQNSGPEL